MCSILALGSILANQIFQVILFSGTGRCCYSGTYLVRSHQVAQPERQLMWELSVQWRQSLLRSRFWQVFHEAQYNPPDRETCLENEPRGEKTCECALEIEEKSFGNVSFLSPGHQPHRHGPAEAAWVCVWRVCVSRCPGSEGRWSCRTKTDHFRP